MTNENILETVAKIETANRIMDESTNPVEVLAWSALAIRLAESLPMVEGPMYPHEGRN